MESEDLPTPPMTLLLIWLGLCAVLLYLIARAAHHNKRQRRRLRL